MLNVVVAGVGGRMGSRIASLALEHPEIRLAGAFERPDHEKVGQDIGSLIGRDPLGLTVKGSLEDIIDEAEVVIDFTTPQATLQTLRIVAEHQKSAVIGTTGFSKEDLRDIDAIAEKIPLVMAPNMSVGINLLFKVLKGIAEVLGDEYDVEIIEAHHRMKKDAPSGTALKLAQVIASALDRDLDEVAVYARKGLIGERTKKEIGIQVIRAGDIVGDHTVIFAGKGERIEITHRASSRDTFAAGALRAALWIYGKPPGRYDMLDVLGLKD